ncbi:DUF188 domain-containing protein [Lottiidibacillus patelloidae]|uniref:UPF0178 protein CIB95_05030 n=1 Tax=Lottiidibacillus patelloidae TaxID=2670334 RepID=A0A263BVF6_9BACI|nr:DUF188 domain-containing protein [Lottiidibacillus patelloidae]OZM57731.1 DUF188 domain-containing protein [Lottiidibacillus patelloidae]
MKIFVDADSCPVKEEILSIGKMNNMDVIFVSSYAHILTNKIGGNWVTVDSEKEEADLYIANHISKGDVLVTQDYGLSALVISKGVSILTPRGKKITSNNIDQILFERFLSSKQRRAGGKVKGPKAFTEEDKNNFIYNLKKIVEI